MLVVGRKSEEGFIIDHPSGPIHVKLLRIANGKARIGIQAPPDVAILRDELIPTAAEPEIAQDDTPHVLPIPR